MTELEKQLVLNLKSLADALRESAAQAETALQSTSAHVVLEIHLGTMRGIADDIMLTLPPEEP